MKMKEKWNKGKDVFKSLNLKERVILIFLGLVVLICLVVAYKSTLGLIREIKETEMYVHICIILLVAYIFPILYPLVNETIDKNRNLKKVLVNKNKEELENFGFISVFYYISQILKSLASVIIVLFINQILLQIPELVEANVLAKSQVYWYFFKAVFWFSISIVPLGLVTSKAVILANVQFVKKYKLKSLYKKYSI
ncbi:hypothetical protein NSB24_27255 [Blautia coccoides]|uniref:FtsX-like permease family protein n=1 Tax=Blautia producta TaxID=33035 RepID=A0ABZ0U8G4_9FIRM|nr:hypothetical protein [Blautia coccoides]MCR1989887.1 hypothetical protein [Blautia coccoides]TCO52266.1 hypothetical protein EV205_14630 [Blautia coccoides]WPX72389.1 hypothetical protein BLCOC_07250 [Blautia coccoides]SUY05848.1 Uncharacterised protein [Blautia coccoides]